MSDELTSDKRLELAYAAAQDRLKLQDATLANTRTRANNLLATTALFVSFSTGVGLISTNSESETALCPGVALVLLLVVVALGISVLVVAWPAKGWCYTPSASKIMTRIADGDSEADIRRYVIDAMIRGAEANHSMLELRQNAFRCAVVLLVVEIALLLSALALY
ncbi:hypothetical protein BST27_29730 [Mycobacterium intermedium]|uniref:Uncharacterized protein n=1 Tax=Mycobacterium intermedium TaxID=28445 RepID=A0A1E3SDT2_MYCIE|nr:hypothetical protein [Mycobacterium intermedium]MCV6963936.1 hypothetical protein [Mycobacterium intermedium]ODR00245.1 hypothetical protein BHQ20_14100 [Mycobacterium intermedium]OPE47562.1 hypothetical protein BV508_21685 [Mycobacterium intermedium]ORA90412.1 hypothetical protein BST27_29730 [Mycobacterium intermedium]